MAPRNSIKLTFVPEYFTLLVRPRVFSRTLGCVARRETACTPRRKCEPRPSSVARALGLRSREFWKLNYGESFRLARAKQDNGDPTNLNIFVCCYLLLYHV